MKNEELKIKEAIGWPCKCGHMNIDGHGAVGQYIMLGICGLHNDGVGCGKSNIMVAFEVVA